MFQKINFPIYAKSGLSKHVNAVGPIFGPAKGEMGPNMKMKKYYKESHENHFEDDVEA